MKYRKKPVVIEAILYTGVPEAALKWARLAGDGNGTSLHYDSEKGMHIFTKEGVMKVSLNDWIICGVEGEFYPCKPEIFEKTYERVEE